MRIFLFILLLISPVYVVNAQIENTDAPFPQATPKPAKTTLRARVYYEDNGRPVKRTSVMLIGKGSRELTGMTDANGNVEIKGLQTGRYFAVVNAPGILSPFAHLDIRASRTVELDERLTEGITYIEANGISDIVTEIVARRGAAIGGRVTYADGMPAIGVSVEVLRKVGEEYLPPIGNMSSYVSLMSGAGGTYRTDDRGIYRHSGLPAGEYIVKVTENVSHTKDRRSGYAAFEFGLFGSMGSLVSNFFENALTPDKAQIITVQLGQELSEINIVIPDRDLHAIEGKLISAKDKLPIRGAKLTIKRVGDESVVTMLGAMGDRGDQGASTDEKGVWRFQELPKGTYRITAEPGSSEFDEKDKAYGNDPTDGDYGSNANRAVANAMNAAARAADGYRGREQPEKPPAPKFAKTVKEFTIDDKDLGEQSIELSYGATIIGTVTFEDEATKDRGSVTLMTYSEKGGTGSQESLWFTDYDGKIKYLKSKDFRLEAIPSGRSTVFIGVPDDDHYVKSAESNQIDLLKGPINFKEGDVFANVKVVISNQTGTLKGLVVDQDKQSVAGAQLVFMPVDPSKFRNSTYLRTTKSRANGEFEVKLPPFEYALVVSPPPSIRDGNEDDYYKWLADAVKKAQTFKVEAGKAATATIKWDVKAVPLRP